MVKLPSRVGDAIYPIKIAAEVLVFIKDCRVLGLRRGDLHHVACWIRSSSSGCVLCVIGRILFGLLAVKDRDKTQEEHHSLSCGIRFSV